MDTWLPWRASADAPEGLVSASWSPRMSPIGDGEAQAVLGPVRTVPASGGTGKRNLEPPEDPAGCPTSGEAWIVLGARLAGGV